MEVHALTYSKKKMDTLFLGVFDVIPCCIQKTSVSDSIIAYDVVNGGYVWGNLDEEEIMDQS